MSISYHSLRMLFSFLFNPDNRRRHADESVNPLETAKVGFALYPSSLNHTVTIINTHLFPLPTIVRFRNVKLVHQSLTVMARR